MECSLYNFKPGIDYPNPIVDARKYQTSKEKFGVT